MNSWKLPRDRSQPLKAPELIMVGPLLQMKHHWCLDIVTIRRAQRRLRSSENSLWPWFFCWCWLITPLETNWTLSYAWLVIPCFYCAHAYFAIAPINQSSAPSMQLPQPRQKIRQRGFEGLIHVPCRTAVACHPKQTRQRIFSTKEGWSKANGSRVMTKKMRQKSWDAIDAHLLKLSWVSSLFKGCANIPTQRTWLSGYQGLTRKNPGVMEEFWAPHSALVELVVTVMADDRLMAQF